MSNSNPRISIVVPCLDDREALEHCLARLDEAKASVGFELEVILADASKSDACAVLAESNGAKVVRCGIRGRGPQLNAGAKLATGELLLFSHADTELSAQHLLALATVMESDTIIGGAFFRDLRWQYPALKWADRWVRAYTRSMGVLYGDQSLFVKRHIFERMGGYADIPIMEDIEFSRRLRRQGRVAVVDPPLRTSMRRFRRRGYLRNKLQNMGLVWLWRLGLVTPTQVYRWYYGREPS